MSASTFKGLPKYSEPSDPAYPPFSPHLRPSLHPQSSNELKGQSTNKTISRNESLRCVNALLIPVSKFHPPAVCCTLMRNKTARSREGGWGNGSMLRLLGGRLRTHSRIHTHKSNTLAHPGCAGCYSRTEACFQPRDSAGLIKEHISICSRSASALSLPIKHTCTQNHNCSTSSVALCHPQRKNLDHVAITGTQIYMLRVQDMIWSLTQLVF